MPEINYKELNSHLRAVKKGNFSPVCLIHGEELLCKRAFDALLDALIPASERGMNYEPVDNDNVYEAIERVNTFSLLPGTKVVALRDSQIFYSKQNESSFLEKAKAAYDGKEMKKAAKFIASLLGILSLTFDDVNDKASRTQNLNLDLDEFGDDRWIDEIIAFCVDNRISVAAVKDNAGDLQKAVEKGFPEGNHLIITTDMGDRRRKLFKVIDEKGVIIDCSVPKGSRMADRKEQEVVLGERMREILSQSGKTMDRNAYQAMYEMTGFDLRTFCNNLEKLVSYAGTRKKITVADVEAVLKRTKQDPIYELTSAVSDRNTQDALFFTKSLLSAGFFPLQILGAMTNQIRKVLLAKGFTESPHGKAWNPRLQYYQFQDSVMPAIREYDRILSDLLAEWNQTLSKQEEADDGKKKKKGKKKGKKKSKPPATELQVAKNPRSPYPVYLMLLKSERFTKEELFDAVERLSEADLKLKTSSQNPRLVLERVILHICSKS
ncbi:hypothetical protein QUF72_13050 [Desulfobacterales bacterium HSG2]|nr:hypothetical protein [Desulfobacterales bacterium HSG2]